eukprot:354084-Chlamydomonas_euryale.AAC.8
MSSRRQHPCSGYATLPALHRLPPPFACPEPPALYRPPLAYLCETAACFVLPVQHRLPVHFHPEAPILLPSRHQSQYRRAQSHCPPPHHQALDACPHTTGPLPSAALLAAPGTSRAPPASAPSPSAGAPRPKTTGAGQTQASRALKGRNRCRPT